MASLYPQPKWYIEKSTGVPAEGYKLYFYAAGTSTLKDTYQDSGELVENDNPVVLDSRGEAIIYLTGAYKVVLKTDENATVWTQDNYGTAETAGTLLDGANILFNGSFETDDDANGEPDGWDINPYSTGVVEMDSVASYHGKYALKFTSVGDGGGIATSELFVVSPGMDINTSFFIKSTAADVLNTAELNWYTASEVLVSTTTLYSDSTTNPTSYTKKEYSSTPPTTARYGELVLTGCKSTDATSGSTWFDGVLISEIGSSSSPKRNYLINPHMLIDQRNAGVSQTITAAAALAYTADRWYAYCTGANVTGEQVPGADEDQWVYQFTGAASVTAVGFGQRIEAQNSKNLASKTVTLSADISNSLLTTMTWTLYRATTSDDTFGSLASPTVTQIATGNWTISSTKTRYSASIDIPAAATTGLQVLFTVGAQISGTWKIGDVEIVEGAANSTSERRSVTEEQMLCYRYYYKSGIDYKGIGWSGNATSGTTYYASERFPVTMRAVPTIVITNYTDSAFPATASALLSAAGINGFVSGKTANATSAGYWFDTYTASSEL